MEKTNRGCFMMVKHLPFKKSLMTALLIAFSFLGSPALKAEAKKTEQTASVATTTLQASVVNINQADLSKLQDLKGIGPAKAQRILDFRSQHGPFKSIEALTQVKGINLRILEQNKGRIKI
ncbi:ComEA family DNA-binding protein [Oceanospirillum sp.]|uniref:ComEA family DNA-binding protein n=1 Tax=Oceanospirillum sp. TaxID=2021254 RepID=UPI003A8CBA75